MTIVRNKRARECESAGIDHDHLDPTVNIIYTEPDLVPVSLADTDPSLDPATLPIVQWSGPCTLKGNLPHNLLHSEGTLIIANPRLYWWCEPTQFGIAINYRAIAMHAVLRNNGCEAVYCQLTVDLMRLISDLLASVPNTTNGEHFADEEAYFELYFEPKNPLHLDELFSAICLCASMHPDEDDDDDEQADFEAMMRMLDDNEQDDLATDEVDRQK